jgi:hypothetical protein
LTLAIQHLHPSICLAEELEKIGKAIDRRNWLVYGVIHVGFGRLGDRAPLEPVIYLLFENDGEEALPSAPADGAADSTEPHSSGEEVEEAEEDELEDNVELDEFALGNI